MYDPRMMDTCLPAYVTKRLMRATAFARRFFAGQRGTVAILIGLSMSVLIGAIALGTDITYVMYRHRQMQSVADSAALAAAVALSKGYPADYALEARAIAATGGFVNGADGVTVTVNKPPASGNYAQNTSAIEVIVVKPEALKLVSVFSSAAFDVTARAVAVKGTTGDYCVLTTDTSSATGMSLSNGVTVNLDHCGAAVNATGSSALSVVGGATLNTLSASVSGQTTVSNGGRINATNGVLENQAAIADPYASVPVPALSGCAYTNRSLNYSASVQQLTPGTYCNGLSISNGARVSMAPGIYYIKSGTFSLAGGSTLTGTGVTIVLTKNTTNYATATVGNGSTITLSAPTTGATAGIVFFSDRAAPTSGSITFNGGSTQVFTGALYFPTQQVVYSNGTSNSSTCTQLIAWRAQITGGAAFNSNCANTGTSPIGGGTGNKLVE